MSPPTYALAPRPEEKSGASSVDAERLTQREAIAFERLAGDEMLTADLIDDVAIELLDWAREKIRTWVAATAGLDEEEAWARLEGQLQQLRRCLRRTSRISASSAHPQTTLKAQLAALDDELAHDVEA